MKRFVLLVFVICSTAIACNAAKFVPQNQDFQSQDSITDNVEISTPAASAELQNPTEFDEAKLGTSDKNITYCTADAEALLMDVYYPDDLDGPWPAAVYVHGGGWVGGDKSGGVGFWLIEPLRRQGFLLASINYRLSPEYQFPAHIEDVKCAIRYLRANAQLFNLDPENIGAFGGSAGGHLVALLGTSDSSAGLEGTGEYHEFSSRVQAVVDMYGPTDSLAFCIPAKIETVFGASSCDSEIVTNASPITHITQDDPPFLILHGDQDDVVPLNQSEILHDALIAGGIESTLIVVDNAGHGFSREGDGDLNPDMRTILQMVFDFFDKHLK
ncbi:MAG: alpha/beta hydrolase [Anaerolineales bacterium]|nr:alpha/beta hydrolase [Chloroflexota bacterium]MBL6983149.1 alpha/beta hydrolase [Anaerolineales bacterium]